MDRGVAYLQGSDKSNSFFTIMRFVSHEHSLPRMTVMSKRNHPLENCLSNTNIMHRVASKGNGNTDEPGAFPSREWLRSLVVGKMVAFETRKQGASAGDRVYGLLNFTPPGKGPDETISVALEAVRNGYATPRMIATSESNEESTEGGLEDEWKMSLWQAYDEAKRSQAGIHSMTPLVRSIKNAGVAFETQAMIDLSKKVGRDGGKIKCVYEM